VQMQPISSQFGYRTCISRIPNFNAQNPGDEGYSAACLGAPDQVNYSLGKGGYLIVDMQSPVLDGPGSDIMIYEGDATPEGYAVYALENMDSYWNYIGSGVGTAAFDLATGGIANAQFLVLVDDNNGTANVNDAGFDLDAIGNIHPPAPDTLAHLSGKVLDYFTGLPVAGAILNMADTTIVTDTSGYYSIDPVRGLYIACAEMQYYNSNCDTLQLAPGVIATHDFYLDYNVGIKKATGATTLSVNPNPFSDLLNIHFRNEKAGRVQIKLTPITGGGSILIADEGFQAGDCNVRWLNEANYNLASGIYVISIETEISRQYQRVIKL